MAGEPSRLQKRFQGERSTKIRDLAERSASGSMSGFQGIFQVARVDEEQVRALSECLAPFRPKRDPSMQREIEQLTQLLLEVQAISHQALLLHGERIKRAQELLREYREGAFTAWLLRAYGNRQTPYNLLQYFEFFQSLPEGYRAGVEKLPRQIVYQLASRQNPLPQKLALLDLLAKHPKRDYLPLLRRELPLPERDRRRGHSEGYRALLRARHMLASNPLSQEEMQKARLVLVEIEALLTRRPA